MNKLLLIPALLLLFASSVFALGGTATLNMSFENVSWTVLQNVTLVENESLFVVPISTDSRINYSYPSELVFTNDTMTLNFTVSSDYEFFADEVINSLFNLSNSLNSNWYIYNLTINVFADLLFNETKDHFINVVNGEYYINISTNLIPKTGSLDYRISGLSGELLKISCPENSWLTCPLNKTFGSNNATQFNINYSIPETAPIGVKTYGVNFTTGNLTLNKNITFNVYEPELILQQYVFAEECFSKDANGDLTLTYDCILEYQKFQYDQTVQIINKLREQKNISCETPEPETLYVGNVEEEVLQLLDTCRSDRDTCRTNLNNNQAKLNEKDSLLNTCNSDLRSTQTKLLNNESACLQNVFSTSVKLKQEAEDERLETLELAKSERRKTVWTTILIIILVLIVIGFFAYRKAVSKEAWS